MTDLPTKAEYPYLLGTDDLETARLGFQHRVWSEQAFSVWERAGFRRGHTILDVGCGPGYAALDLARLVGPDGKVVAIDESARFIEYLNAVPRDAGLAYIDARVGDVQKLDLPAGSVDGAYARWVLCFVSDPEAVVAGVARALKPSGTFAVQDYFSYQGFALAPRSPALERVAAAVVEIWKRHGGDANIVGRLPAMMTRHGLEVTDIRPIVRIARPGTPLWHWPETFFKSFCPTMVAEGVITRQEQEAFHREWNERARDPNAFLFTPPNLALIATKK